MAGLAPDTDLGPIRLIGAAFSIIATHKVRRMAIGAHPVPVLIAPGPMDRLACLDALIGVKVEPALPALFRRPGVPGQPQRLHSPVRKGDQVLLQWDRTKCVGDLVVTHRPVRAIGVHPRLAVSLEEPRVGAGIAEHRVVEIAEDSLRGRRAHSPIMMGAGPSLRFGGMARCTIVRSDIAAAIEQTLVTGSARAVGAAQQRTAKQDDQSGDSRRSRQTHREHQVTHTLRRDSLASRNRWLPCTRPFVYFARVATLIP